MSLKDLKGAVAYPEPSSCEVWVCRDIYGCYSMFDIGCDPRKDMNGFWRCYCAGDDYHYVSDFCQHDFKQYTGLPHHMRKGTRKKVRWIYPLQFMDNKVEVK